MSFGTRSQVASEYRSMRCQLSRSSLPLLAHPSQPRNHPPQISTLHILVPFSHAASASKPVIMRSENCVSGSFDFRATSRC
eukprot:scaffold75135_cov20-Tisochrysis_lutea.AAC.1